ncbi:HAMP domain-containing sensor histidine kinase [Nocardioides nanhaiensis]|uniref:histidine kinase n=1 Tax=Nocardioides nanhaiensis TaxID=1476871 RepID=A0ABP8WRC0_9ACTN
MLRILDDASRLDTVVFVTGFMIVMLTTVAALLTSWERLPGWAQLSLPVGDLLGATLMVLADPGFAAGVLLLFSLPVVWLAFEFGRPGLLVGLTTTGVVGVWAYLDGSGSDLPPGSPAVLVTTLFVMGLGVVAHLMSGILHRVGETLQVRADEVDAAFALATERLEVMNGVMESIGVGVAVQQVGTPPVLNASAQAMTSRMGASPAAFGAGGDHVFTSPGRTSVAPQDQVAARALAGEEFAGVMHWIGLPGDQRVIVSSARQLLGPGGERWASVLAMWDATELVDAIEVREDFLTTISHELRTPLTAITASMDLLTGPPGDLRPEDGARLLGAVTRNTEILRARIEELLTVGDSTEIPLRPARTDVTALVREALSKHDSQVAASSVTLVESVEPEVRAEVDPTLFEQVVDNLVSNAVKYTGAGGRVSVSLHGDRERLVLSVVDSGSGMTFDEQRQVFQRFYRAPSARTAAIQGLGIGLCLVKSIVERHQGEIDLRSSVGVGTAVTVTLPVTRTR